MAALGIIGIVVGVAVLIYGAYKGISTIILAPLCALLIALFNGMNLWIFCKTLSRSYSLATIGTNTSEESR